MFWTKKEEENSLVELLKSSNYTLQDILLDKYVVQESKYGNTDLIQFITERENMTELLNLSLNHIMDESLPMKNQFKLSFIASEILTIRGQDEYQKALISYDETKQILIDFVNNGSPINHLIAGFFAKIVECLLDKQFESTINILRNTNFFEKCLKNISLGAVGCLLENLLQIPCSMENTDVMKQWMLEDKLLEKIIDRISDKSTDDENECLSEVYCELIRELRDKLYLIDNKEDVLHARIMDDDLISKIADKLVVEENVSDEDLRKRSSSISAAAKILERLISSNIVNNSPSKQISEELNEQMEMRYSHFDSALKGERYKDNTYAKDEHYEPDQLRIVEGTVANRMLNILNTVLRDIENSGVIWQPLLRLVCEVCNTNHLPTHEKICEAFRALPFLKLFETAKRLSKASILHSLVDRMVSFILYATFDTTEIEISPAAEYLLRDSGLISSIYETAFSFQIADGLVASAGLRTLNMNVAQTVYQAKQRSKSALRICEVLRENALWPELEESILDYNFKHRPLQLSDLEKDSSNLTSVQGFDKEDRDFMNDSEEWSDAATRFAIFDKETGSNTVSSNDKFNFNLERFSELDGNQLEDTPDEDEFKKMCSQRANSSSYSVHSEGLQLESQSQSTDTVGWPGVNETSKAAEESADSIAESRPDDWIWPKKPPTGETDTVTKTCERPQSTWVQAANHDLVYNPDDASVSKETGWADFSSFSTNSSEKTEKCDNSWPGIEEQNQEEDVNWPKSHDEGLANSSNPGFSSSEKDNSSSEA